jgi:hypothetical protein
MAIGHSGRLGQSASRRPPGRVWDCVVSRALAAGLGGGFAFQRRMSSCQNVSPTKYVDDCRCLLVSHRIGFDKAERLRICKPGLGVPDRPGPASSRGLRAPCPWRARRVAQGGTRCREGEGSGKYGQRSRSAIAHKSHTKRATVGGEGGKIVPFPTRCGTSVGPAGW